MQTFILTVKTVIRMANGFGLILEWKARCSREKVSPLPGGYRHLQNGDENFHPDSGKFRLDRGMIGSTQRR
jgi:hypothetical protein